jgi:hypothetical protein
MSSDLLRDLDGAPRIHVFGNARRHGGAGRERRRAFAAVLFPSGTIGIRRMARISHPISESALDHTVNWYFSLVESVAATSANPNDWHACVFPKPLSGNVEHAAN